MTKHTSRVILLAGPSGSGKSYIARRAGLPVLGLDDFYKNADDPTVPRRDGRIDWESPLAWDATAAVAAIARLAEEGHADIPVYAIEADRRVGTRRFDLAGSPFFVAEGIFAAEVVADCDRRGLLAGAYVLRRPRGVTFVRRLVRDLREGRKPPAELLRRGWALLRAEPAVIRRQAGLGCRPAGAGRIVGQVAGLVADAPSRQPVATNQGSSRA